MKINVNKLDATIAKLQELRRLATDPALANFVDIVGAKNNSNGTREKSDANGNGTLKASVLDVCKTMPPEFTIKSVHDLMKTNGYAFTGEDPLKSVGNVLRALASDGAIRVAVGGKGRRATTYSLQ